MAARIFKGNDDLDALFAQYVNVCNAALAQNRTRFPYKSIWDAAGLHMARLKIHAIVVDHGREITLIMLLREGRLDFVPGAGCGCTCCQGEERYWRVGREALELAVDHPQLFISQPARLDWSWLVPAEGHLSAHGKPELQAAQAYSDNCTNERA
ncbi:MAG: hypothetical protein H6865_04215 [Rhodospirillales bacterium]|nr:hypothetical protein [Alphaproteobacteria bacterium]MCB9986822.1 hypothetical protein [Rhodospirillales bacterium]USO08414.1 MAG: hypothetical protein H6866_04165 [Rhodospirillales bacterium]